MKNKWYGIGIAVLLLVIMVMGYGGLCSNEDDDTSSGSSSVTVNAPSSLAATVITGTSGSVIKITWQNNANNVNYFCLYQKSYSASSWTLYSNTIGATVTEYSFPAKDLSDPPGNFYLCLTAYNSDKSVESEASNIILVTWTE